MAKKNTFYGAIMDFGTVSTYYPVNLNYPDFDRFVFQQMIEDGSKADDDYTLVAFAVNADGTVLNGQNYFTLAALPAPPPPVPAKKNVNFANMKLDLIALAFLYPAGLNSDLWVYPTAYFKKTGYVIYAAQTHDYIHPLTPPNIYQLNPSPPY